MKHFADRQGLRYPLLGDGTSTVIRAFGILNESIPKENLIYGVPYPGTYIVDSRGIVKSNHFETDYRERVTAGAILAREFASPRGGRAREITARHLKLVTYSSNDDVYVGSHLTLVIEVALGAKLHVYAPGVSSEYIPIQWNLEPSKAWTASEVTYPPSRRLHLKAIRETVPVFERRFRLLRDLTMAQVKDLTAATPPDGLIKVAGTFRYQACDDRVCHAPETVPVEWTLRVMPSDRQRVPPDLRKLK